MNLKFLLNKLLVAAAALTILPAGATSSDPLATMFIGNGGLTGGISQEVTPGTVLRENQNEFSRELKVPVLKWSQNLKAPQAVLVALHGSTLHGGTFDQFAKQMVSRGYMVVAPDIRGFGRWLSEPETYLDGKNIEFYKDRADLVMLLQRLHTDYPDVPVYCIGESLGSNMSLWVASVHPDLVDGIILSSPCIKRRLCLNPRLVMDFFKSVRAPHRQVTTAPYAKKYLSESQDVINGYLDDPGIRKTMSAYESFQSFHVNESCLLYVENIPQNMPILVIEGTHDEMYACKAVKPLMKRINSADETIHYLPKRGHIHLMTSYVKADVVKTVDEWLRTRVQVETARRRNTPSFSAKQNEDATASLLRK